MRTGELASRGVGDPGRAGRRPPRRRAPQGQARAVRVLHRDHHRRVHHRGRGPGRPGGHPRRGPRGRRPSRGPHRRSARAPTRSRCWREQRISPSDALRPAGRGDAVDGPPAADLRHPRPRRRAVAREGRRHRQRPGRPTSRTSWRCRRRARTGRATTPAWRRAARRCSRACPPPACPPPLETWADFESSWTTLVAAEAIATVREVWWDIRPHPDFGTVELRMCDGMPDAVGGRRGRRAGPEPGAPPRRPRRRRPRRRRATRLDPAGEQVAGRPLRPRRRAHRRRAGHACRRPAPSIERAGGAGPARRPPSWAAPTSWPASPTSSTSGPATERQRRGVRRRQEPLGRRRPARPRAGRPTRSAR